METRPPFDPRQNLDTRQKIVPAVPPGCDVLEGCFDPLLAEQALVIRARKQAAPLAVVVRDPADPLLDARARAELVAALGAVDFVVMGGDVAGEWIEQDRKSFQQMIRAKHGR